MLQRVATLVHSLVATQREGLEGTSPAAGEQLAATLRVLRAAPATRLALDWTDGGLPAQACCPGYLGQLTGLTELSLRSVRLPAEAASALCSLTGLLDLSVEARLIPKALLNEALPRLTRLTRLHLGEAATTAQLAQSPSGVDPPGAPLPRHVAFPSCRAPTALPSGPALQAAACCFLRSRKSMRCACCAT